MKAIFFEQHGDINVLKYADLPEPKPQPGEALIRVKSVALNHLDIWVRKGWPGLHLPLPHIGGADISGEIVEINAAGTAWTNGSRVIVYPGISTTDDEWTRTGQESLSPGYKIIGEQVQGGFAEYVTVPVKNLFRLPEAVTFEDGAAPPARRSDYLADAIQARTTPGRQFGTRSWLWRGRQFSLDHARSQCWCACNRTGW